MPPLSWAEWERADDPHPCFARTLKGSSSNISSSPEVAAFSCKDRHALHSMEATNTGRRLKDADHRCPGHHIDLLVGQ